MWSIEVKHGLMFPADEPGAIGVLLGIDRDDGERISVVVDPEWLRTLLAAIASGADMGRLDIPDRVMLPIAGRGWDDDWTAAERDEIGHMRWLFLQAECDWARLRAAVDVLTGFRQESPGLTPEG